MNDISKMAFPMHAVQDCSVGDKKYPAGSDFDALTQANHDTLVRLGGATSLLAASAEGAGDSAASVDDAADASPANRLSRRSR